MFCFPSTFNPERVEAFQLPWVRRSFEDFPKSITSRRVTFIPQGKHEENKQTSVFFFFTRVGIFPPAVIRLKSGASRRDRDWVIFHGQITRSGQRDKQSTNTQRNICLSISRRIGRSIAKIGKVVDSLWRTNGVSVGREIR